MPNNKTIEIINAAHDGYRRAGLRFHKGQNTFDESEVTDAQLAMLKADTHLAVSVSEALQATTSTQEGGNQTDTSGHNGVVLGSGGVPNTLIEAITLLDPSNSDHFTTSGKPKTECLSELMKRSVSASERDEAWQQAQDAHQSDGDA